MTYQIKKIALNLNGRMTVFKVKVANEIILLGSGTEVQAICHINENGDDGKIRFWTPEGILAAEKEAMELENFENSLCKVCFKA